MIGQLRGQLLLKKPSVVLVYVRGVGYEVHIPLTTFYELPDEGSEIILKIYTHVREDALSLYGFRTQREKDFFLKLLSISGIGPKLAITVLSGLAARFDPEWGGFSQAPKFPSPANLFFLLERSADDAAREMLLILDPRPHGSGRPDGPGGRRLPPLLDGRGVARAALREDAVRQRLARPALRRGLGLRAGAGLRL